MAPRAAAPGWTSRLGRWTWWSITAPLSTLGVAAAFVLLGAIAALVLLALGTGAATLVRCELRQSTTTPARRAWPAVLDVLGGWSLVAVVGLAAEFGAAGFAMSAVVVGARWLVYRRRRPEGAAPGKDAGVPVARDVPPAEVIPCDPLPEPSAVPGLSMPRLCLTWRLAYAGMQRPDCPAYEREHLAALRSACLDELERRNPVAFQRWLPTARAASDPARFFCPPQAG